MKYLGSKNKIAKHILPIILKDRTEGQYYVEPFMGGGNMIDKVEGLRIGNDLNYHLIELWRALQRGWVPPDVVTEDEYQYFKKSQEFEDPALVAFIGFLVSFGGKWFAGYAKCGKGRNYAAEAKNNIMQQVTNMQGVQLFNVDYREIPDNSIIYCDPPYRGTTGYLHGLDHEDFWQWCRDKSQEGHQVFISEYTAPDDFECILKIDHASGLDRTKRVSRTEKLFKFNEFY